MLEDNVGDILEKARRGLALRVEDVCAHVGIEPELYAAILRGAPAPDGVLERLGTALALNAEGLARIERGSYRPEPSLLPAALERVETRFDGYAVNAYLWKIPQTRACLLFDAGYDAAPIVDAIERARCELKGVFITHAHSDHTGGLDALKRRYPSARLFFPSGEGFLFPDAEPLRDGERLLFEKTSLRTLGTDGHAPHALAYFLDNPDWPLLFTGDALFAGSMGGAPRTYETALASARALLALPPKTLVCPGHGPYTTLLYERAHNPFLATRA